MCCVERPFDVLCGGAGDFADRLPVDWAVIGKVFVLQRRYPVSSDEVVVFRSDSAFAKRADRFMVGGLFQDICNCHGFLL